MDGNSLSPEQIHALYGEILKFCSTAEDQQCKIYTGTIQGGYGIISKTIHGRRYRAYAHRIVIFHHSGVTSLPSGSEVSHLCHNKRCINIDHLSVEPHAVNNTRIHCYNERHCSSNHVNFDGNKLPDCIFF